MSLKEEEKKSKKCNLIVYCGAFGPFISLVWSEVR